MTLLSVGRAGQAAKPGPGPGRELSPQRAGPGSGPGCDMLESPVLVLCRCGKGSPRGLLVMHNTNQQFSNVVTISSLFNLVVKAAPSKIHASIPSRWDFLL